MLDFQKSGKSSISLGRKQNKFIHIFTLINGGISYDINPSRRSCIISGANPVRGEKQDRLLYNDCLFQPEKFRLL